MKQLIICLLLVISTGLLAQSEKPIEKGQLMLGGGGSFGYGSELSDSETTSGNFSISLDPSMGLFIRGSFGYNYHMINLDLYYSAEKMKYHSVAFIPAVGYAFFLDSNVALEIAINNKLNMEFRPEQTSTLSTRSYFSAGFQIFL